jgi:hypothetical protein
MDGYQSTAHGVYNSVGDYTVYAYGTSCDGGTDYDWARVWVFRMDADMGLSEASEEDPGLFMGVGETAALSLSYEPSNLYLSYEYQEVHAQYNSSPTKVQVLENGDVIIDGTTNVKAWRLDSSQPRTLTVEACNPGIVYLYHLFREGSQSYPGSQNSERVKVTVADVEITRPRSKSDVPDYNNAFRSSTPYCFENQGVTSGCPGSTNVQTITGVVLPETLSYNWSLDTSAGTISPLSGSLTPAHSSPAMAGTGTLRLYLVDDPSIYDEVEILIYEDHLERDIANFKAGKKCTGPSDLQLEDGSYVEDVSLTCASSANPALKGTTGSASYLSTLPKVVDKEPWAQFVNRSLSRGQILNLHYRGQSGNPTSLHWQTVVSSGTGASAQTYAADSVTKMFRYETVDAYYDLPQVDVDEDDRWVTVYNP